ncbi:MAG: transposase [Yoonia sp.]|nr:transposase [Yoonia sp.]
MGNVGGSRSAKHTDDFKRLLVAQSRADGVSVPMVSKRHGVSAGQIYAWRGDARFQPAALGAGAFSPGSTGFGGGDSTRYDTK